MKNHYRFIVAGFWTFFIKRVCKRKSGGMPRAQPKRNQGEKRGREKKEKTKWEWTLNKEEVIQAFGQNGKQKNSEQAEG